MICLIVLAAAGEQTGYAGEHAAFVGDERRYDILFHAELLVIKRVWKCVCAFYAMDVRFYFIRPTA